MSFSFIRKSRIFGIAVIILVVLLIKSILLFFHDVNHGNEINYFEIHDVKSGYRFRRITLPQKIPEAKHRDDENVKILQQQNHGVTTAPQEKNHHSLRSECHNFYKQRECADQMLSSPNFSDFPEYKWPTAQQMLGETVGLVLPSASDELVKPMSRRELSNLESTKRQIKQLECSYPNKVGEDGDEDQDQARNKRNKVRIFVPWKSFTYMTPYPLVCPTSSLFSSCELTNSKEEVFSGKEGVDAYLVDTNGAYITEVYDWVRNPSNLILVAFNTENIEGRRDALKKGYGLRYLAKPWNSTWWNYFQIQASYHSGSQVMVDFFHWAVCRDESFQEGYFHWAKNSKNSNTKDNKISLLRIRGKLQHKTSWRNKGNAPILYFVRNCDFASHRRSGFMMRLQKYIRIDSVGKCNNNKDPRSISVCDGMKSKNRRSCIISDYRFYLAIENSISLDYVSEKVYEPLLLGTIPIYLGAPNVADFLPTKHSAILAKDFTSLKQLSGYVKCIMNNITLYEYYTSWFERPFLPGFERKIGRNAFAPMCDICEKIAKLKREKEGETKRNIAKVLESPKVNGNFYDYGVNSQAPLKECLKY